MSQVFITDYIDDPYIEQAILGDSLVSVMNEDVEVLLVWHQRVDKVYIDNFPKLKGIVRYGVGFDNIDLVYAKSRGIYVCNTPDYGTEEVSDTAIAMIMNIARGITRYDFACREYTQSWQENTIGEIRRNSDYRVGVIGAGRIGGSVLLKAKALRFQTAFYDPYVARGHEKMLGAERLESLEALLESSDIVSIHTPLTEETAGMVDTRFIEKMKQGSSLVNTARGKIIGDIDVFYEPLKRGELMNVALDVLPQEPPSRSPLLDAWRDREAWLEGRLIINPHTAYYSTKAYYEMRQKAASNAKRIVEGEIPLNIVV